MHPKRGSAADTLKNSLCGGSEPPPKDYVEGGMLAYLLRLGGWEVLLFGGMNYIEREVVGLRPEIVLVAAARPRREIHDYTGRLLRALGQPPIVVATHWDNQGLPFGAPQDEALAEADTFVAEVKAVAPRTRVLVPQHFETIVVEPSSRVHRVGQDAGGPAGPKIRS